MRPLLDGEIHLISHQNKVERNVVRYKSEQIRAWMMDKRVRDGGDELERLLSDLRKNHQYHTVSVAFLARVAIEKGLSVYDATNLYVGLDGENLQ